MAESLTRVTLQKYVLMGSGEENSASYVMKCQVGLDGYWEEMPAAFCEMLGYTEKELKKQKFSDITHPEDISKSLELGNKIREGTLQEFEVEKRYVSKSGNTIWVYVNGALIKNDRGEPEYVACYIHDITDRKREQKKLEESEKLFRSLFEHNPHPVFYIDTEGNFLDANSKFEKLSGYSISELREKTFAPFVAPEDLERTWKYFEESLEGDSKEYEITGITRSGERREVRITNFPIIVENEIMGVFGIAEDITEQNKAKRRLKESEERWKRLVRENPQPIQITQDAEIIFINQAGAELYGAESPDTLIGKSVYNFSDDEKVDKIKKRKKQLESGNPVEEVFEHKINGLDGEERYVEIHSIPTTYKDKPTIQSVLYDITEQKQKEREMTKSLDQKEMLLREIHHRVKNNLAVISGLLELQAMNTNDDSVVNTLRDSQLRVQTIAMIHEKLYQTEALADIGFDRYLKELVQAISSTYSSEDSPVDIIYNIDSCSLNLDQAIPCSLIVNEIIVNCYKHAFSSSKKGQIELGLEYDNAELQIEISDNGDGLPEDFDIREQQSLGLTLIQTLADQLDGEIVFLSDDNGTTFRLAFEPES